MPAVDVSQVLTDLEGEPLLRMNSEGNTIDLTLKDAIKQALLNDMQGDEQATGEEKFERYQIAVKVHDADGEVELDHEEIVQIKKRVGDAFATVAVGAIFSILK